MTGSSDSKRSESQGGFREELSAKEGRSKDNDRRNTNRQRGWVRAMSVRGSAKSKSHRKTHQVEPDGTESKMFMHLTRGDLRREIGGGVSRGRSSEERRGNTEGAKGLRTKRGPTANHPAGRQTKLSGRCNSGNHPGRWKESRRWNPAKSLGPRLSSRSRRERRRQMRPNEATMEAPKPTLAAVLEKENFNRAWEAIEANKGAAGRDGRDIARAQVHIREHWESIEGKLRSGAYNPGPVRGVTIPKPNGGERTLGVPNVQDRFIQQAIHEKLSERCEPFFSENSYGFRPMRSAHDAVRAAQELVKQGKRYVVDIDLKSFFDEVNHDKLTHQGFCRKFFCFISKQMFSF